MIGRIRSDWFDRTKKPLFEIPEEKSAAPLGRVILDSADNRDELEYAVDVNRELQSQFESYGTPRLFKGELYQHQRAGYVWLRRLWDNHEGSIGGLLADDMGLGKTIQVAALIAHMFEKKQLRPTPIVAPTTVINNWSTELGIFVDANLKVVKHMGPSRTSDPNEIEEADIVLTSFQTLSRDQFLLGPISFQMMICDEAQYIKNYATQRATAARAMKAKLRLPLTATPVENRLGELWAIMDFASPGLLGSSLDFNKEYVEPIEQNDLSAASDLLKKMEGYYLRRTKKEALKGKLPEKHIYVRELRMTSFQKSVYLGVLDYHQCRGKCALPAIQGLLTTCAHPFGISEKLLEFLNLQPNINDVNQIVNASAKFIYLIEELEKIKERGERAIVFSDRIGVQNLLRTAMRLKFDINVPTINGAVSTRGRTKIIEKFQEKSDFGVLLLSPLAAGVGINVTNANHVFHISRTWNPAKENQATDRAYRIGQEPDVFVHTPYVNHPDVISLDVRLNELMNGKQALAENVIRPSGPLNVNWQEMEDCLYAQIPVDRSGNQISEIILPSATHPSIRVFLSNESFQKEMYDRGLNVALIAKALSVMFNSESISLSRLSRSVYHNAEDLIFQLQKFSEITNLVVVQKELIHFNHKVLKMS